MKGYQLRASLNNTLNNIPLDILSLVQLLFNRVADILF
jgi:hypothetical protein